MFRSGSVQLRILFWSTSVGPSIETKNSKKLSTKPNLWNFQFPMIQMLIHVLLKCLFLGPIFEVAHLLFVFLGSGNPPIPQSSDLYPGLCWFGYSSFWIWSLGRKGETRRLVSGRTSSFNKDVILEFGGREGWILSQHPGGGSHGSGFLELIWPWFWMQKAFFPRNQACNTQVGRLDRLHPQNEKKKRHPHFLWGKNVNFHCCLAFWKKNQI